MTLAFGKPPKIYDTEAALYDYAIRTLSRKMRTVAELKRLLRVHSPPNQENLIDSVILRLKQQKYLNDTEYAERYALSRKENKKFGRRRVEIDLIHKGIVSQIIHPVVDSVYQEGDEKKQIRAFLGKKKIQAPTSQKETGKIFRALTRAGFQSSAIFSVLKEIQSDKNEGEDG